MKWADLFSEDRNYKNTFSKNKSEREKIFLNHYSRDPDRVLFSSSFRRLQGKTQVYIFPQTDFVRNRLTHSLEVSSIGRSLARGIFQRLSVENTTYRKEAADIKADGRQMPDLNDILDIVAAACYAHDLGNPPFGHIGEYAIRSWFKNKKEQIENEHNNKSSEETKYSHQNGLSSIINDKKYNDFMYFDGNAQAFRVTNRLEAWGYRDGGLCLTAATIGALIKYPNSSSTKSRYSKKDGKFGYYNAEKIIFEDVCENLKLKKICEGSYARHPLAYITEAADDIAYLTSDIEDARKFGMISYDEAKEYLLPAARFLHDFDMDRLEKIIKPKNKLKFLRSAASLAMVERCVDAFITNEDRILSGTMDGTLLQNSDELREIEIKLREACEEKIYHKYKKIRSEAGAYEIIKDILSIFSEAIEENLSSKKNSQKNITISERSINLIKIIDQTGRNLMEETDAYNAYLKLIDYISGMTDKYAMDIFDTLAGKRLALGY
ncbi:dGTP triphosphohydrolase [Rhizobium panacihumi]|uniref:dGTP triphosphohydrolase n=1 Tax=Rhizobium panacihumi TaxID=2008450 RepID=UPI003D7B2F20